MSWNYCRVAVNGVVDLYEVYYDENDQPVLRTQVPVSLDDIKELDPDQMEDVAIALYAGKVLDDAVFTQKDDIGDARTSIEVVTTIQVPLEFAERIKAGAIQGLSIYTPPPEPESLESKAEGAFYSIQNALDSLAGWSNEDLANPLVLFALQRVDRILSVLVDNPPET